MGKATPVIIILVVLLGLGGIAISSYNALISSQEEVQTAQSDIDTNLQRRADLIPNLVASVKSYAKHEEEVFQAVLDSRQSLMNASTMEEKAKADEELTSALQGLNVVVEAYPELKADTQYTALMDELAGSENRIAISRQNYNAAVKTYNKMIKSFPTNIFAGMMGFESAGYYEAPRSAQENPDVNALFGE